MDGTTDRSARERERDRQDDGTTSDDRPGPDQIGGTRTGDGGTGGERTDRQDVTQTMTGEEGTDEGAREPSPGS
jgi:hypothetical protein